MNQTTANPADYLACLDANAAFYVAKIDRLCAEASAHKAAGETFLFAEIREEMNRTKKLLKFACDRAAEIRAARAAR